MIKMNKLNLTKGKIIGYIIALVGIALSAVLIVLLNSFDKVELVSTYNRTFEKATVTKITKDNLEEDGERYGNQEVVLKIKTGSYAGKELSAISPNGNLFGAPCTVGLDVVAIVTRFSVPFQCFYRLFIGLPLCFIFAVLIFDFHKAF